MPRRPIFLAKLLLPALALLPLAFATPARSAPQQKPANATVRARA